MPFNDFSEARGQTKDNRKGHLKTDVSKFEQISSIITQPGHDCLSFDVVFIIIIHCKGEIVVLNYIKLDVNFLSEISLIKPAPVKPYH